MSGDGLQVRVAEKGTEGRHAGCVRGAEAPPASVTLVYMRFASFLVVCAALAAAAEVPRPAPSFSVHRVGAADLPLSSYRGKVLLLVFISTTCPHCQDYTRELGPLSKEYGPKGVQIVESAVNPDAQTAVPGFVQQFQPPFTVGYNTQAEVDKFVGRSIIDTRPFYVPHAVFLDRQGRIQGDYAGESDFMKNPVVNTRAELDKLLSEKPASASKTSARKK